MNLLSAEVGLRGYYVYRETFWQNVSLHQYLKVVKETNETSIVIDPYYCKIMIKDVDRIRDNTVGHISRELLRFVFCFIHKGGSVT